MLRTSLVAILVTVVFVAAMADEPAAQAPTGTTPGAEWVRKEPGAVGLDASHLAEFSKFVGGRGCVIRHGYLVHSWGDASRRADIASAAKVFYSHFLFKAVEDERIGSLDEKVIRWEPRLGNLNEQLGFKDAAITWRHFANQTSCYQLVERPGTAFDYNDWQMALFWDTLFLKVYGTSFEQVDNQIFHSMLMDRIGCQDAPTMMAFGPKNRPGRVSISVRDFARFGLLYLRHGEWNGQQLVSRQHATMAVSNPLPNSIPRAGRQLADMIVGQRSLGSTEKPDNQTDHFGSYSWLWWTNGIDREGNRFWPDAPHDTYGAFGHGGPRALWVIPSLDIVVSYNDANLNGWYSGSTSPTNQAMRRLIEAVRNP